MSTPDHTELDADPFVVDPPACFLKRHTWLLDFEWGDTCCCGEYYLLRDERGLVHIEETPPREL